MVGKPVHESEVLQHIQQQLLMGKLPYVFSTLTVDSFSIGKAKTDGTFFEIVHPSPHIIDVIIGCSQAPLPHALTLAAAIKYDLVHFAKPLAKNYQFDKAHLWGENLFTPQEIVKRVHQHFITLFDELETSLCLFYGRFNLDYQLFTYLNYGFNQFLHLDSLTKHVHLMGDYEPALGSTIYKNYPGKQLAIHPGDGFIFYSNYLSQTNPVLKSLIQPLNMEGSIDFLINQEANAISNHIKLNLTNWPKDVSELEGTGLVIKLNPKDQSSLHYPIVAKFLSDFAQLEAVRLFIGKICQQAPGDAKRLSIQLQLAVNEIFCNIVQHSYHYKKGKIIIEGQLSLEGIYITLSDQGDIFNPLETPSPNLTGVQENGFGMFIVQQIADQLNYVPKTIENQWNHLRIFKRYFFEEEQMEFSHRIQDNILVITPQGEHLDAKNASVFKEEVLSLIASTDLSRLVFDLNHLQFIDSSGLGTFLSIQRTLNTRGGTLKLAHLNKPIRTMFEIVSMHRIFDIFATSDEAIRSF
jgi:anti-anti-sigma factor